MIVIWLMEHLAVVVVCHTTQIWLRHSYFRSLDPEFHLSQGNVPQSLYLQSYNLATLQPKVAWHSATMLTILTISHYNMSNRCKLRLAPLMISVTLMWYSRKFVTQHFQLYVTGFDKTLHMGFFVKIEFDVYLISSTIELTIYQVWDRLHASLRS